MPSSRPAARLALATVLTTALVASCTSGGDPGAGATAAPSSSAPATETAPPTRLTRADAPLEVSIEQLRGGVPPSARPRLVRAMSRPIASWLDGAFLVDDYPRSDFPAAFADWTPGAAAQAAHDSRTTTNAALGPRTVAVVADRQRARLFVFASRGRTGGATARVSVRLSAERLDGTIDHLALTGSLYLTRSANTWSIFGYDLERTVSS